MWFGTAIGDETAGRRTAQDPAAVRNLPVWKQEATDEQGRKVRSSLICSTCYQNPGSMQCMCAHWQQQQQASTMRSIHAPGRPISRTLRLCTADTPGAVHCVHQMGMCGRGLQKGAGSWGSPAHTQRFHGAFTGGFSAGYFNTVGSKVRSCSGSCVACAFIVCLHHVGGDKLCWFVLCIVCGEWGW